MYYTYVLRSLKDKKLYIGSTSNIAKRIQEHNNGLNISTKKRRPFELIYCEKFQTRKDARWREYKFKKSHDVLKRAMQK
jgi:putative endonuclease